MPSLLKVSRKRLEPGNISSPEERVFWQGCKLTTIHIVSEGIHIGVDQHACDFSDGHHTRREGGFISERESKRLLRDKQWRIPGHWRHFFWYAPSSSCPSSYRKAQLT